MKVVIMGDDTKAQRLLKAFNRLHRSEWNRMPLANCKGNEIRVLFYIKRGCAQDKRGVTISALSSMMEVTSPTVTPLIKGLESSGLVLRYNDQEDRRVVRVQLTESGEEVTQKAMKNFESRFTGLFDFLGEEKSDQLADLLEQVHQYKEMMLKAEQEK
ncbi:MULTISPECIES: MarR family winged helix-turn-helix transcriptional regulator [Paenibacillus]|nr:MarR family transcriptional regulator [Paenibacillus anaericanus]